MNKLLYIIPFLAGLLACQKEDGFNYKMHDVDPSEIDSVFFSAGTDKVVTDGKAALSFHLEAYRTVYFGDSASELRAVNLKSLPSNAIHIYDETGAKVDMTYYPEEAGISKTFYAQIGSAQSELEEVEVYAPVANYEKRYVNVVFHVLELDENDDEYDPLTYKKIDYKHLETALNDLNRVFNNEMGNSPNAASANIEFRLAEYTNSGSSMGKPGYNQIIYTSTQAKDAETLIAELDGYYSGARYWNHDAYLNIFVMPFSSDLKNTTPQFQNVSPENVWPGMGEVVDSDVISTEDRTFNNLAAAVERSLFQQAPESRISIANAIGRFYGLYATTFGDNGGDFEDYCSDTQKYITSGQVNQIVKTGLNGEKFNASNAMDAMSNASYRNHITANQAARVRFAIENCPGRMNGLLE
ncbi:hypothetical protein KEM09_10780 [Carboxylicivirga mesophila]|uniref:Uncharacterized protein n=1 Tax=Carboxylicivirga mesophila TaxID=1166478 RepID=A0ABS5KAH9_9BACT|nr:hypothetical protein [Carboxylicivirga mesophila]MBS2211892.1 hypothetical protein [Carboxylicivirga mesophila]